MSILASAIRECENKYSDQYTTTEQESPNSNASGSRTHNTHVVGFKCSVNLIPHKSRTNFGGVRLGMICDLIEPSHRNQNSGRRGKSRVQIVATTFDLTSNCVKHEQILRGGGVQQRVCEFAILFSTMKFHYGSPGRNDYLWALTIVLRSEVVAGSTVHAELCSADKAK